MWSDGSCYPNPGGPGGWGVVLESGTLRRELSGSMPKDWSNSNNRAELLAVINGLKALHGGPHDVTIITDSEYTQRAIVGIKRPKYNFDLLREISELVKQHRVTVEWVRGHTGNPNNERCDQLALSERERVSEEVGEGA